jgi:hypothetical protein
MLFVTAWHCEGNVILLTMTTTSQMRTMEFNFESPIVPPPAVQLEYTPTMDRLNVCAMCDTHMFG